MILEIEHRTIYRYSSPVTLNRHVLRMTPRCDAHQRVLGHELLISPEPSQRLSHTDAWGNPSTLVSFSGDTRELAVEARMTVETRDSAVPFRDALAPRIAGRLDYGQEARALAPYLDPMADSGAMSAFVEGLGLAGGESLFILLQQLNRRVAGFRASEVRLEGAAQTPEQTISRQQGVCRDLAVLFMAACRYLGIATRFVSGYQLRSASGNERERYLHAWAEVYLPGLGWRGYDQTHAMPVADDHVVIACGPSQAETMPLEGSIAFIGDAPKTRLDAHIHIHER